MLCQGPPDLLIPLVNDRRLLIEAWFSLTMCGATRLYPNSSSDGIGGSYVSM